MMKQCVFAVAWFASALTASPQSIPLGEIVGQDRSIRDPLYGLSARYPDGWTVRGVTRWGERETTIYLGVPILANSFPTLYYRMFVRPEPVTASAETLLRDDAAQRAIRRVNGGLGDYVNVPESFVFKTIGGHPALSYMARYSGGGKTMCECFVRVLSDKGIAQCVLRAPLDEMDAVRADFEGLVDSLRLP